MLARFHIVLEWLGKPYETHKLSRDELKGPEFLKINPLGAVPALADGDWTLTQNVAILEYLAEQAPQSKLMGDGSARSAPSAPLAGLHQLRPAQDLLAGLRADALPVRGRRAEGTGRQRVQAALKLFAQLDAQLAGKSYLVGADPSVADAYLYVVLTWAHGKQVDLTGLDNLAAFFKRMQENSGVKAARKAEGLGKPAARHQARQRAAPAGV